MERNTVHPGRALHLREVPWATVHTSISPLHSKFHQSTSLARELCERCQDITHVRLFLYMEQVPRAVAHAFYLLIKKYGNDGLLFSIQTQKNEGFLRC